MTTLGTTPPGRKHPGYIYEAAYGGLSLPCRLRRNSRGLQSPAEHCGIGSKGNILSSIEIGAGQCL